MRKSLAILNATWRAARSYRLRLIASIAALCVVVVPVYFVANGLQQLMGAKIVGEGSQYFGFVLVGMVVFSLLSAAVTATPNAISGGISNGSLEALLTTPVRMPELLLGLSSFDVAWALVRAVVVLTAGAVLGARLVWGSIPLAIAIALLIVLSYIPFGLIASAMVLAFRTPGPLPQVILLGSGLLGGVYYPTRVIPGFVRDLSSIVPLTYGLRALRSVLLDGAPLGSVIGDIAVLAAMTLGLFGIGALAMQLALRHVRRSGSLTQY